MARLAEQEGQLIHFHKLSGQWVAGRHPGREGVTGRAGAAPNPRRPKTRGGLDGVHPREGTSSRVMSGVSLLTGGTLLSGSAFPRCCPEAPKGRDKVQQVDKHEFSPHSQPHLQKVLIQDI